MVTKEINDGMVSSFAYDQLVVELLDTPEVQRMRGVKQNGPNLHLFPSLAYPRIAHLIGTSRVATESFHALQRNGSALPGKLLPVLQAIALMHDIGHAPFSHGLERVILGTGGEPHEDLAAKIVLGQLSFVDYFSERPHLLGNGHFVREALKRYEQLPRIPDILRKYGVDPSLVAAALSPRVAGQELAPEHRFLKNLIDGSLWDIDKADYLPRDAKAANVDGSVDVYRMFTDLRIVTYDGERRLAVADNGLRTLTRWVSARKYMYHKVYRHKTVLKFEAMLSEAVKRSMPHFKSQGIEIHLLTDSKLLELLTEHDPVSAQLALDVQYGRPFKYAMAYTISAEHIRSALSGVKDDPKDEPTLNLMLLQGYMQAQTDTPFPEDRIRDEIVARAKVEPHDVLVMFPVKMRTEQEYRQKMDLVVYVEHKPNVVASLVDVLDDKAPFYDRRAQELYHELCKPESRYFFVVFSPQEHRDAVNKATQEFVQSLRHAA